MKKPVSAALIGSGALLWAFAAFPVRAQFDPTSALCRNGECGPVITQTTYAKRPAYRLSDGKSEAVIVPSLGRVMRWGKVGGPNLLWNAASVSKNPGDWKNYGGDKTWLSPQSSWKVLHGSNGWPPDTAFDGTAQKASVLTGGKLKLVSPTSPRIGIRLERVMSFNERGEFVIEQTAIKTAGAPVRLGLWSISQSNSPDAVFLPTSPTSPYKNGFYNLGQAAGVAEQNARIEGNLLRVSPRPLAKSSAKFGVDAPVSAIVAVKGDLAWLQQSAKPAGQYPDGSDGAGFPVEVYVNGDPNAYYVELELLGPLVNLFKGSKMSHTVRWSLHDLPSKNVDDAPTRAAIEALLK